MSACIWNVTPGALRVHRHAVGNAKLEGLVTQLNLTGNKYNIVLVRWPFAKRQICVY